MLPFILVYFFNVVAARVSKKSYFTRYTHYIWHYLLLYLLFPGSTHETRKRRFHFIFMNAWGLFLGVQMFWYADNYNVLRQLGKGVTKNQRLLYWIDFVIHTGPIGLLLLLKGKERRKFGLPEITISPSLRPWRDANFGPPGAFSGLLPFGMHIGYSFFIRGDSDLRKLYEVESTDEDVRKGWILFFIAYMSADAFAVVLH